MSVTAVERLARWLMVAVILDLLVTRFVVRLAMFVPKGEPWATLARAVGRLGAALDVLVPIVGVLVLGALLVHAGRTRRAHEGAMLAAVAIVALGGFALVVLPPSPALLVGLDILIVAVAVAAAVPLRRRDVAPSLARLGLGALAAAVGLTALDQAWVGASVLGGATDPGPFGPGAAAFVAGVAAQFAFVAGAGLIGLGGILDRRAVGSIPGRLLAAAVVAATIVLVAWLRAPAAWDSLTFWSIGLSGVVPVPLVALALGLAVAGLPLLHRSSPLAAVGATITLAAGVGLAASGLVLAGLLGLIVAGTTGLGRPTGDQGPASSSPGGSLSSPEPEPQGPARPTPTT